MSKVAKAIAVLVLQNKCLLAHNAKLLTESQRPPPNAFVSARVGVLTMKQLDSYVHQLEDELEAALVHMPVDDSSKAKLRLGW